MKLVAITETGETSEPLASHPLLEAVIPATLSLYQKTGFVPPWISYVAVEQEQPLGTCAFKSPPHENRVEIAYFTFPEHERTGVGSWMAHALICLALNESPALTIFAQTLPRQSASTSILTKLGFRHTKTVEHSADGTVWEWEICSIENESL